MRGVSTAQLWSLACGGAHFPLSSFLYNWKVFLTFTRYFTKNCFNIFPHSSFTFSRFMTHTKKNCNSLINVIWNEWWIKKAIWNSFMTSFVYGLYFFLFLPVQHTVSVNLNLWYVVFLIRINLYVCRGKQWVTHYLVNFLFAVLYFVFVVASSKFIFCFSYDYYVSKCLKNYFRYVVTWVQEERWDLKESGINFLKNFCFYYLEVTTGPWIYILTVIPRKDITATKVPIHQ